MSDKKEQILEAAEDLFAEYGFEGTSVRDLAKKAKVNVAMISYYFGSKEELMKELIQSRAGSFRQQVETLSKESVSSISKIDRLIDLWIVRVFDHYKFHRVLNHEISLQQRSAFNKIISDIMLGNFEEIRKLILEGQKKKEFRKVDVELTITTLIGTISKVAQSSFLSCRILNIAADKNSIFDDKHKERLKQHLKDLMRAHLLLKK